MLEIAGGNKRTILVVRADGILAVDLSKIQNDDVCGDYFRRESKPRTKDTNTNEIYSFNSKTINLPGS
jgi:hypothetical protein